MNALRARLKAMATRIDALSLRERALIFGGLLAILLIGSQRLLFDPLNRDQGRLEKDIAARLATTAGLQAQVQQLARELGQDPDAANRQRIAALKARIAEHEASLGPVERGLVGPREMAQLIEQALRQQGALKVLKVENLPPETVVTGGAPAADAPTKPDATKPVAAPTPATVPVAPPVYRHGLRIVVQGSYFDLARGLRAVESLPWRLLWTELALAAGKYPVSQLTLTVHTLSYDRAWIGL